MAARKVETESERDGMKRQLETVSPGVAPRLGRRPHITRLCATALLLLAVACTLLIARPAAAQTRVFEVDLTKKVISEVPMPRSADGVYVFWVEFLSDGKANQEIAFPGALSPDRATNELSPRAFSLINIENGQSAKEFSFRKYLFLKITVNNPNHDQLRIEYTLTPGFGPDDVAKRALTLRPLSKDQEDEEHINQLAEQLARKRAEEFLQTDRRDELLKIIAAEVEKGIQAKNREAVENADRARSLMWGTTVILILGFLLLAAAAVLVAALLLLRSRTGDKDEGADSPSLRPGDLKDAVGLVEKLLRSPAPMSRHLFEKLEQNTRRQLVDRNDYSKVPQRLKQLLTNDLNRLLAKLDLAQPEFLAGVTLTEETRRLMEQNPQGKERVRLNRMILADAYPDEIAKGQWGRGPLSKTLAGETSDGRDTLTAQTQIVADKVSAAFTKKLANPSVELLNGVRALIPAPRIDVKEDVKKALEEPPVMFLTKLKRHVEDASLGEGLSMSLIISTLENMVPKFERLLSPEGQGGGGGDRKKTGVSTEGSREMPAADSSGVRTDREGPGATPGKSPEGVNGELLGAQTKQLDGLLAELKDRVLPDLKSQAESVKEDQERLLGEVRAGIMALINQYMFNPPTQEPQVPPGGEPPTPGAESDFDDELQAVEALGAADAKGATAPEAVKAQPEADAEWSRLVEQEEAKVNRRWRAAESFIEALKRVNPGEVTGFEDWLKNGKAWDDNFLKWLRERRRDRSEVQSRYQNTLRAFNLQTVKQFVGGSAEALRARRSRELEDSFKELLNSAELKYSWEERGKPFDSERHEDADGHSTPVNAVVAEVLSPFVYSDNKNVLIEPIKAKVRTGEKEGEPR